MRHIKLLIISVLLLTLAGCAGIAPMQPLIIRTPGAVLGPQRRP